MRIVVLFGLMLATFAAWGSGATLQAVNVVSAASGPRVELQLSAPADAHLFTLSHPARLVIDLSNTRRASSLPVHRVDAAAVKKVRTGIRHRRDLRVVLELDMAPKNPHGILLPVGDHYRYAVSLGAARKSVSAPASAASANHRQDGAAPAVSAGQSARRPIVVAIDPGHGGKDPGAHGPDGLYEKTVTLRIAKRLARLIDAQSGMQAFLTRTGDYYVSLTKRRLLAYQHHADLFVSIHADSYPWDRHVSGASVYMLSEHGATSVHARLLAERENRKAAMMGAIDLSDKDRTLASVLVDLAQTSALEASYDVAARVLHQLDVIGDLHDHDVQRANFAVLRSAAMPSILIETAYISSYRGERRLGDGGYQRRVARAILRGIDGYFQTYRPQGTMLAGS